MGDAFQLFLASHDGVETALFCVLGEVLAEAVEDGRVALLAALSSRPRVLEAAAVAVVIIVVVIVLKAGVAGAGAEVEPVVLQLAEERVVGDAHPVEHTLHHVVVGAGTVFKQH